MENVTFFDWLIWLVLVWPSICSTAKTQNLLGEGLCLSTSALVKTLAATPPAVGLAALDAHLLRRLALLVDVELILVDIELILVDVELILLYCGPP
jgi:hypothetical protein